MSGGNRAVVALPIRVTEDSSHHSIVPIVESLAPIVKNLSDLVVVFGALRDFTPAKDPDLWLRVDVTILSGSQGKCIVLTEAVLGA